MIPRNIQRPKIDLSILKAQTTKDLAYKNLNIGPNIEHHIDLQITTHNPQNLDTQ